MRSPRADRERMKGVEGRKEAPLQSPKRLAASATTRQRLREQLASDCCEVDVVHLPSVRAALAILPSDAKVVQAADLLSLLANPTRLKMLLALQPAAPAPRPELCVCDLATVIGASKSLTSHQLRLLRASGVVRQRRAGKLAFYQLADGPMVSILAAAATLAGGQEHLDLEQPRGTGKRAAAHR